jgi:hypothetical protein
MRPDVCVGTALTAIFKECYMVHPTILSPFDKLRLLSLYLQQRQAHDFPILADHAEHTGWSMVAGWLRQRCDRPHPDSYGALMPLAAPRPMTRDVASSQVYRSDHYPDRLQILRLLEAAYPVPSGLAQPMDGIVLQTAWQAHSGRARYAWWSRLNSSLNLWQLLALQSRGELAHVVLTPLPEITMPDIVQRKILAYYDHLRGLHEAASPLTICAEREATAYALQTRLWDFHVAAIHAALAESETALSELPAGEHDFAEAWGKTMVEFLALVAFPTTAAVVHPLNGPCVLPPRILQAADLALEQPSDLEYACRISVRTMCVLHRHEQHSGGRLQRQCAAIVRLVPGGRFLVREAIEHLFEHGCEAERVIKEIERQFSNFLAWVQARD